MNSSSGTGWLTGSLAAALSLANPSWTMTSTLIGGQQGLKSMSAGVSLRQAAMCLGAAALASGSPSKEPYCCCVGRLPSAFYVAVLLQLLWN